MGTDIHTIAQVEKNGEWETVAANMCDEPRNYDSFAVLANVRNGSGFAGVKTGQGWVPISEPRGLPDGVSYDEPCPVWYSSFDKDKEDPQTEKWLGDHSHSWLMMSEISAYLESVKNDTYRVAGVVSLTDFYSHMETGKPYETWCGDVWGGKTKVLSQQEAIKLYNNNADKEIDDGTEFYVRTSWSTPAPDRLWYLYDLVKKLTEIAQKYGVDDVRFVFGFDS